MYNYNDMYVYMYTSVRAVVGPENLKKKERLTHIHTYLYIYRHTRVIHTHIIYMYRYIYRYIYIYTLVAVERLLGWWRATAPRM